MTKNNRNSKKIFVDLDGTVYPFNEDAKEEELRTFAYYYNSRPMPSIYKTLRGLYDRGNVNLYVLSAYLSEEAKAGKRAAVRRDLKYIMSDENVLLVPYGTNKAEYVKERFGLKRLDKSHILLDDHSPNCIQWDAAGGRAIKVLNNINGEGVKWRGERMTLEGDLFSEPKEVCKDRDGLELLVRKIYEQAISDWKEAKENKVKKADIVLAETESFLKSGQYNMDGEFLFNELTRLAAN